MATEPSCYFGGIALQAVVTANGLSSPVTTWQATRVNHLGRLRNV